MRVEEVPGVPDRPEHARRGAPRGHVLRRLEAESTGGLEADVLELFGRPGTVVKVPEKLMGAAGALMGVGPAYQALLVEAQVDAERSPRPRGPRSPAGSSPRRWRGPPRCSRRATTTRSPIRREVTSPGGTTARGLAALERGGVRPAFQEAFDAVVGWTA